MGVSASREVEVDRGDYDAICADQVIRAELAPHLNDGPYVDVDRLLVAA